MTAVAGEFRCAGCGSIDSVHYVERVDAWYDVVSRDGVVTGLGWSREIADEGDPDESRFECPSCLGPVTMADGSSIDAQEFTWGD